MEAGEGTSRILFGMWCVQGHTAGAREEEVCGAVGFIPRTTEVPKRLVGFLPHSGFLCLVLPFFTRTT